MATSAWRRLRRRVGWAPPALAKHVLTLLELSKVGHLWHSLVVTSVYISARKVTSFCRASALWATISVTKDTRVLTHSTIAFRCLCTCSLLRSCGRSCRIFLVKRKDKPCDRASSRDFVRSDRRDSCLCPLLPLVFSETELFRFDKLRRVAHVRPSNSTGGCPCTVRCLYSASSQLTRAYDSLKTWSVSRPVSQMTFDSDIRLTQAVTLRMRYDCSQCSQLHKCKRCQGTI
jgi:hypothetical protein